MISVILLVASAAAAGAWPVTPADVDRCVQSNVHKLLGSGESSWDIANKAIASCHAALDQLTAARDRATAKEAGRAVPEWNSLEWRAAVTKTFWQSALRSVDLARRAH